MIAFKHHKSIWEWEMLDPLTREVIYDLEIMLGQLVITRIWDRRPIEEARADGESGIHCSKPHRAADGRKPRNRTVVECKLIASRVSEKYLYDPERPSKSVCIFHRKGRNPWHFHIQAHPRSRRVVTR